MLTDIATKNDPNLSASDQTLDFGMRIWNEAVKAAAEIVYVGLYERHTRHLTQESILKLLIK